MKQSIKLHIEELVLHGFDHIDGPRIGAAVETELTRLLSEGGVPSLLECSGEYRQIDAGTFNMAPHSRAEAIGAQVGQAVYGGIKK